ncbi:MAG: hypothetical protein ABH883_06715, partial [Candidatus Omnitrophota bacterium]
AGYERKHLGRYIARETANERIIEGLKGLNPENIARDIIERRSGKYGGGDGEIGARDVYAELRKKIGKIPADWKMDENLEPVLSRFIEKVRLVDRDTDISSPLYGGNIIGPEVSAEEEALWKKGVTAFISDNETYGKFIEKNKDIYEKIQERCVEFSKKAGKYIESELREALATRGIGYKEDDILNFRKALANPKDEFLWCASRVETGEKYFLGDKYNPALDVAGFLMRYESEKKEKMLVEEYILHEALEKISLNMNPAEKHRFLVELTTKRLNRTGSENAEGSFEACWADGEINGIKVRALKRGYTPLGRALRAFITGRVEAREKLIKFLGPRGAAEQKKIFKNMTTPEIIEAFAVDQSAFIEKVVESLAGRGEETALPWYWRSDKDIKNAVDGFATLFAKYLERQTGQQETRGMKLARKSAVEREKPEPLSIIITDINRMSAIEDYLNYPDQRFHQGVIPLLFEDISAAYTRGEDVKLVAAKWVEAYENRYKFIAAIKDVSNIPDKITPAVFRNMFSDENGAVRYSAQLDAFIIVYEDINGIEYVGMTRGGKFFRYDLRAEREREIFPEVFLSGAAPDDETPESEKVVFCFVEAWKKLLEDINQRGLTLGELQGKIGSFTVWISTRDDLMKELDQPAASSEKIRLMDAVIREIKEINRSENITVSESDVIKALIGLKASAKDVFLKASSKDACENTECLRRFISDIYDRIESVKKAAGNRENLPGDEKAKEREASDELDALFGNTAKRNEDPDINLRIQACAFLISLTTQSADDGESVKRNIKKIMDTGGEDCLRIIYSEADKNDVKFFIEETGAEGKDTNKRAATLSDLTSIFQEDFACYRVASNGIYHVVISRGKKTASVKPKRKEFTQPIGMVKRAGKKISEQGVPEEITRSGTASVDLLDEEAVNEIKEGSDEYFVHEINEAIFKIEKVMLRIKKEAKLKSEVTVSDAFYLSAVKDLSEAKKAGLDILDKERDARVQRARDTQKNLWEVNDVEASEDILSARKRLGSRLKDAAGYLPSLYFEAGKIQYNARDLKKAGVYFRNAISEIRFFLSEASDKKQIETAIESLYEKLYPAANGLSGKIISSEIEKLSSLNDAGKKRVIAEMESAVSSMEELDGKIRSLEEQKEKSLAGKDADKYSKLLKTKKSEREQQNILMMNKTLESAAVDPAGKSAALYPVRLNKTFDTLMDNLKTWIGIEASVWSNTLMTVLDAVKKVRMIYALRIREELVKLEEQINRMLPDKSAPGAKTRDAAIVGDLLKAELEKIKSICERVLEMKSTVETETAGLQNALREIKEIFQKYASIIDSSVPIVSTMNGLYMLLTAGLSVQEKVPCVLDTALKYYREAEEDLRKRIGVNSTTLKDMFAGKAVSMGAKEKTRREIAAAADLLPELTVEIEAETAEGNTKITKSVKELELLASLARIREDSSVMIKEKGLIKKTQDLSSSEKIKLFIEREEFDAAWELYRELLQSKEAEKNEVNELLCFLTTRQAAFNVKRTLDMVDKSLRPEKTGNILSCARYLDGAEKEMDTQKAVKDFLFLYNGTDDISGMFGKYHEEAQKNNRKRAQELRQRIKEYSSIRTTDPEVGKRTELISKVEECLEREDLQGAARIYEDIPETSAAHKITRRIVREAITKKADETGAELPGSLRGGDHVERETVQPGGTDPDTNRITKDLADFFFPMEQEPDEIQKARQVIAELEDKLLKYQREEGLISLRMSVMNGIDGVRGLDSELEKMILSLQEKRNEEKTLSGQPSRYTTLLLEAGNIRTVIEELEGIKKDAEKAGSDSSNTRSDVSDRQALNLKEGLERELSARIDSLAEKMSGIEGYIEDLGENLKELSEGRCIIEKMLSLDGSPIKGIEPGPGDETVIFFEEFHWERALVREYLSGAGVIKKGRNPDGRRDTWTGKNVKLIFSGMPPGFKKQDIEFFRYVKSIQDKAPRAKNGSEVIRLAGSAEILSLIASGQDSPEGGSGAGFNDKEWIGKLGIDITDNPAFVKELKQDILDGKVRAACETGGRLFIQRFVFDDDISQFLSPGEMGAGSKIETVFAEKLNELLKTSVRGNDYSNPAFYSGSEYGSHRQGLFFAYISWYYDSDRSIQGALKQVAGNAGGNSVLNADNDNILNFVVSNVDLMKEREVKTLVFKKRGVYRMILPPGDKEKKHAVEKEIRASIEEQENSLEEIMKGI